MTRKILPVALGLLLAACGGGPGASETDPANEAGTEVDNRIDAAKVVVDANGLSVGRGSVREAPRFGTPRGDVDALLTTAYNAEPNKTTNNECGAGATDFSKSGSLQIAYQDSKFVGWLLNDGSEVVTSDGIRLGTKMSNLRARHSVQIIADSNLQGEFQYQTADYGIITGFYDGGQDDAKITALAAGVTCYFR